MDTELLKVSLRQGALFLPTMSGLETRNPVCVETLAFVAEMRRLGYTLSEPLLRAVDGLTEEERGEVIDAMNTVLGTKLNWASLVKGWLVPTGETRWDHFVTFMANVLKDEMDIKGTTLPCGHLIPDNTFPMERYNGCPFCGTPFQTADFVYKGQGTKLKVLELWGGGELLQHFQNLLQSPVPLDATQLDSLKTLLKYFVSGVQECRSVGVQTIVQNSGVQEFGSSGVQTIVQNSGVQESGVAGVQTIVQDFQEWSLPPIGVKETLVAVADALIEGGRGDLAGKLFTSPRDILRYLWYRHTGNIQIVKPSTILDQTISNQHINRVHTKISIFKDKYEKLKLKYTRPWCKMVAQWLNGLEMPLDQQLEVMHTDRGMWVRFIRALRLAEYAKKPEMEQLRVLLDRFYREDYSVWQGELDQYREQGNAEETLRLLSQRPGVFARSLFSTMLWFGRERVIDAFHKVLPQVAPRLLLTLGGQAELWFDRNQQRVARILSGIKKQLPPHALLNHYSDEELQRMKEDVVQLYLEAMRQHFAVQECSRTIYIDPELFDIPVSVGDRSDTIQDTSSALQGQRFKVQGDHVRLFMQWGEGLPEQWLDMDLSCFIVSDDGYDTCAYFNLTTEGAKHSGDIQHIPDQVGTAEYIELSLPELQKRGAKQVIFTCNAYSDGAISPNLKVGWMSCEHPMSVSDETGVAYDPSTVDHCVRISETNLDEGLVFGVLDVNEREITWIEVGFDGQTVLNQNPMLVNSYLERLRHKPTIGQVLSIKAEVQNLTRTDNPEEATECYTLAWAKDTAAVSRLLLE